MESESILQMNIVDVCGVEGRKSPNMERVAFERGLDSLIRSYVAVKELVTDGHLEIKNNTVYILFYLVILF